MNEEKKYPWQRNENKEIFNQLIIRFMGEIGIPLNLINLYGDFIEFEWEKKLKRKEMENDDFHKSMLKHLGAIDITQHGIENIPQNFSLKKIRRAMEGNEVGRAKIAKMKADSKIDPESVPIISLDYFMSLIDEESN